MATFWTNDDGLVVRFGVQDAQKNIGSRVVTAGEVQQIVVPIADATSIGTSPETNITNGAYVPADSIVTSVTVYVDTAFTSGGLATLEVGSYDATGSAIDADGFCTIAVADLTADTAVAEASIPDTTIAADSWVGVTYGTAAFTAGSGKVVIEYVKQ